jgi:hypothetical protein
MRYAVSVGLVGALALGAATGWFAKARTEANASSRVAQYCVPPEENSDTIRIYCRNGAANLEMLGAALTSWMPA